jgi:hypothetical protein
MHNMVDNYNDAIVKCSKCIKLWHMFGHFVEVGS